MAVDTWATGDRPGRSRRSWNAWRCRNLGA